MDVEIKPYVLLQITCEVRYRQGYRYLDRCGDTLVRIEDAMPGWAASDVNLNSGSLENKEQSMKYVFGPSNAALTQTQISIKSGEAFLKHAGVLITTTLDSVKPSGFDRLGIRFFDLRGVASASEGIALIERSEFLRSAKDVSKLLGKEPSGRNLAYRVEDEKSGLTLRVATVRRSGMQLNDDIPFEDVKRAPEIPAHKQPKDQDRIRIEQIKKQKEIAEAPTLGVLVDLDFYEKRPKDCAIIEFVKRGFEERRRILGALLTK